MDSIKKIWINGNFYFSVKRAIIVSLAIIIILSGVALGVGFGLRPIGKWWTEWELWVLCMSLIVKILLDFVVVVFVNIYQSYPI